MKEHTWESGHIGFRSGSDMYVRWDLWQVPQSVWIEYLYLSDGNISICAVFTVKSKGGNVKKATLQSVKHVQM